MANISILVTKLTRKCLILFNGNLNPCLGSGYTDVVGVIGLQKDMGMSHVVFGVLRRTSPLSISYCAFPVCLTPFSVCSCDRLDLKRKA